MSQFDRNETAFIRSAVDSMVQNPRIGRVQQVFEHAADDDQSNLEVDVRILGEDVQHRAIPYQHESNGEVSVPTVGDKVIVEYRHGNENLPIARNVVYTNEDRPPLATAGMWRKRVPSGNSPAGDGDLYIESYTDYDMNPATDDPSETGSPEESWIRIAKKGADDDEADLPVNIELHDSPTDDAAHVKIELNSDDGSASTNSWGIKFDLKTGEFKLLDPEGYGIVSDGAGNFTWHHEDVNFSEGTTDSL